MLIMMNLNGLKVFIAGGTSGLGFETAVLLSENGASVTVSGRTENPLLSEKNISFIKQGFDENFSDKTLSDEFKAALKNCSVLILSFGPFLQKPLDETRAADWKRCALLNFSLQAFLISQAVKSMKKNGGGKIIAFGSSRKTKLRAFKTTAAYSASKTALEIVMKSALKHYKNDGISGKMLYPGFVTSVPPGKKKSSPLKTAEKILKECKKFKKISR